MAWLDFFKRGRGSKSRKTEARAKTKPKPAKPLNLTERLIAQMLADGMTYTEIHEAFPELDEQTIRAAAKRAMAKVPMFLDGGWDDEPVLRKKNRPLDQEA
ncbi:DUF433 domain-containing protein [Sulfidibacter corallicola]|uniref:DUF433 domain-containing protein n=1 Tax=Sulfidibacter corallicola TaxID=2818388 RepID=A0A8A4TKC2_SULCO|nr:DUF433 domain-containing protein [Sulfidibacter corallicola]QTD49990.1 DUF433 domain-containing protein [Sulfidibacter corallicola]